MSEDERLVDTIPAFRVNQSTSEVVRGVVKKDRRTISDVARALLERGVAAYLRDGQLFEPEEQPDTITVPRVIIEQEEAGKKKRRG